jgi:hypothetical protein
LCTQPHHLHRKLAEKSRDATLAKRYAKALETRLVLLEAEVTELRSEARLKSARSALQLPLQGATSFFFTHKFVGFYCHSTGNSRLRYAAAESIISNFISDPYAVAASAPPLR